MTESRWSLSGPTATFGVTVRARRIVDAAPIARAYFERTIAEVVRTFRIDRLEPEQPCGRIVLVTGSRVWTDEELIFRELDRARPWCVVHGAAKGADDMADAWAWAHGIPALRWPAAWTDHGKAAGMVRNAVMIEWLTASRWADKRVLAFPRGESRGTRGCVASARQAGLNVQVFEGRMEQLGEKPTDRRGL